MKGIVITSDRNISVQDFGEPLYQTVGKAVGGYIEVVRPKLLPQPLVMIVNEEGRLRRLPLNPIGSVLYGTQNHGQPIVGDIVIMQEGFVDGEPDIIGIEDDENLSNLVAFFEEVANLGKGAESE